MELDMRRESLKKDRMRLFCILLTAAAMGAMAYFSGQPDTESYGLSTTLAEWLLKPFTALYSAKRVKSLDFILRKLAHIAIYFTMGCGLMGVFPVKRLRRRVPLVIFIGMAFALSDEFHQSFSSGRNSNGRDVLLDTCAVAAAAILLAWQIYRRTRIRTKPT